MVDFASAVPAADGMPLVADVSMLLVAGSAPVAGAAEGEVTSGSAAGVNRPRYSFGTKPARDTWMSCFAQLTGWKSTTAFDHLPYHHIPCKHAVQQFTWFMMRPCMCCVHTTVLNAQVIYRRAQRAADHLPMA